MKTKIILALLVFYTFSSSALALAPKNTVSSSLSKIYPLEQVASGTDAVINVELLDYRGEPVPNHVLRLISSTKYSEVKRSALTNSQGKAKFFVNSSKSGNVSYSVYDLTSDVVLESRARVAYMDAVSLLSTKGRSKNLGMLAASTGNSSGGVAKFEIDEVDENISSDESVNFTLKALDEFDQPVTNYLGTVMFSIDGENDVFAQVPEDYTFTSQDQGEHTFSLALRFLQNGDYKMKVVDVNDVDVEGEYIFKVGGASSDSNATVVITNPISGTYSNGIQTVSGRATPGSKLGVYIDDVRIGEITAGVDGRYSYTTPDLMDAKHTLYVAEINEVGTITSVSKSVELAIDSSPPEISSVELNPDEAVNPQTSIAVKLNVSEELDEAKVKVDGNLYPLTKGTSGTYVGAVPAPIEFGEYPLEFILVDALGNETRQTANKKIKVGVFPEDMVRPADVPGLKVDVTSEGRVDLSWQKPQSQNPIQHYRIFYGVSPTQFTNIVDTFDAGTKWYIPDLKNGIEYFFGVAAVDNKGNVSEKFVNIVSAVPGVGAGMPVDIFEGRGGEDALDDMTSDVSETGPEMIWLLAFSIAGGFVYRRFVDRKHTPVRQCISEVRESLSECLFK